MRRLMTAIAIMLVCVAVSGCTQDVRNALKTTKKYYREYVNTPAELAMDSTDADPVEDKFAVVYTPMGMELEQFRRDLTSKDTYPSEQWMNALLQKYPWLSGVAAVTSDGRVLMQRPEFSMKSIDFTQFVQKALPAAQDDEDSEMKVKRALRGVIQKNPLGDEVLIGMPYFIGNEYKGFVVSHFDPRNLMENGEGRDNLVMVGPSGPLWTGKYLYSATPLAEQNWEEVLADDSSGYIDNDTGEFFWVSKFFGNLPLAFATTTDTFPLDPDAQKPLKSVAPVTETVEEAAPVEEVAVVAEPVVEKPAPVVPALHETPHEQPSTADYVWSVQIGAFQTPAYAQDRVRLLAEKGASPCLMKLYDQDGQLWNVVQIGDFRSKSAAFKRVGEFLRLKTGLDYNVELLDAGVVQRRKQCF